MKHLSLVLSDGTYALAEEAAKRERITVPILCTTVLTDHFLLQTKAVEGAKARSTDSVSSPAITRASESSSPEFRELEKLDLRQEFRGYPEKSLRYAESVLNTLKALPIKMKYKIRPNRRGIVFAPNFIAIEYLLQRRDRGGLALSLGRPVAKFANPPAGLKRGRTDSYSWILIENAHALNQSIPLIQKTFESR